MRYYCHIEDKEICFKWETGQIITFLSYVLYMTPTELKKFIKAATVNGDEVKAEISAFLSGQLEAKTAKDFDNLCNSDIPEEHYKKLLAAVEGRKQTKQERTLAKIINNCTHSQYQGVFQDAGKYCVCDGYRLIRCASPLVGFDAAKAALNTEKAVGEVSKYTVKLSLPSAKDLKADIKLAKNGVSFGHIISHKDIKRAAYDFGYGLPRVNAEYLLSMLEALPDCEAFAVADDPSHPVYFVSGDDDGILLPIRKCEEIEEPPVVVAEPESVEEPDDFSDINVEEIKAALEYSEKNGSAFVDQVIADVAAITKEEPTTQETNEPVTDTLEIVAADPAAVMASVAAFCSSAFCNLSPGRDRRYPARFSCCRAAASAFIGVYSDGYYDTS